MKLQIEKEKQKDKKMQFRMVFSELHFLFIPVRFEYIFLLVVDFLCFLNLFLAPQFFIVHIFVEKIIEPVNIETGFDFTKSIDDQFKTVEVFMHPGGLPVEKFFSHDGIVLMMTNKPEKAGRLS